METYSNDTVIFCDFDGTITKEDTVDKFLETFANDNWLTIEKLWQEGEINSKECLTKQIECIDHITDEQINNFVKTVEIDKNFPVFLDYVKSHNIDFYIVSDGFGFLIKAILAKYGIQGIKIFSNDIILENNKLKTVFPYHNKTCLAGSGLCKCNVVNNYAEERKILYIGDGQSDKCVSAMADILFAKNKLIQYCISKSLDFIPFETFDQIIEFVQGEETLNARFEITIGQ